MSVSFSFLYLMPDYALCVLKIKNILNEYIYSNTICFDELH